MSRKLGLEYPGANYHVMNRGDRCDPIFDDDQDRQRFLETYNLINAKFQEVFPRLFCGGRAELHLTDEEDLLETGIEIIVQPPGKKLGSVACGALTTECDFQGSAAVGAASRRGPARRR
jgi:hypothetical protein